MIAYKGFTKDLTARLGIGNFQYEIGKTYEETECKTVRNGFHCCENPFQCLSYYSLGGEDRFCEVEAEEIDEDDNERIACKKITILRELSLEEFAKAGYEYMAKHPKREGWQIKKPHIEVGETATATEEGDIAISRALLPSVRVVKGAIVGLMVDDGKGHIGSFGMFRAKLTGIYRINEDGWTIFENAI